VRVAVVVIIGGAALIWSQDHGATTTDGPDHASTAPAGPGYTFLATNRSGTPRRWNPCAPITYVTNFAAAPYYAADDLQAALTAVSAATGIRFVDKGTTRGWPTSTPEFDSRGHPKPVLIAWADAAETARLHSLPGETGQELGRAGPGSLVDPVTGHGIYVTGDVLIDAAAAELPPGPGPGGLEVLFLHELGHLVGLGHVNDVTQVMNPTRVPTLPAGYGPGDLAGLNRLGADSGCLHVPHRPTTIPF
jgi:hypothetical protein